jgi:hypothetical protein
MPSAPVINGKYTIKVWKTNDKARFLIYFRDAGKLCMKRIFFASACPRRDHHIRILTLWRQPRSTDQDTPLMDYV